MADLVDFYQIYYRDDQKQALFPFSKPHYNAKLTLFFENSPISALVKASEAQKIGVCSWKLREKLKIRVGRRSPLTQEALEGDYQVLGLTRNSPSHRMMARATVWHPGFLKTIRLLWEKVGIRMPHETRSPIYFNHFVAEAGIYKGYVTNFLDPAMEAITKDEELNTLMMEDSKYSALSKEPFPGNIKTDLGINYYPMIPFVLERCPSLWFELHKIKVTYL